MITKTFICDMCKKSVGEGELFQVSTELTIPRQGNSYSGRMARSSKDICGDCLKAKGIVIEDPTADGKKNAEISQNNQKTFETKVVELLEDLGVAFVE